MPAEAVLPISMAKSFILALFVEPNVLKKPSTYSVPSAIAADFSKFASSTAASKVIVFASPSAALTFLALFPKRLLGKSVTTITATRNRAKALFQFLTMENIPPCIYL